MNNREEATKGGNELHVTMCCSSIYCEAEEGRQRKTEAAVDVIDVLLIGGKGAEFIIASNNNYLYWNKCCFGELNCELNSICSRLDVSECE